MAAEKPGHEPNLRIGELAELAATTTRAIRYYHSIGLLDEPTRDASGYRRYGAEDLIRLVRIRRLRSLEMPLEQIAAHLSQREGEPRDLQASLRELAKEVDEQIIALQALKERLLHIAASTLALPVDTWRSTLRAQGVLGEHAALPDGEHEAVNLLDALHPDGVEGVITQSSGLLGNPELVRDLKPLLLRFRELPDDEAAVEVLASEIAALLPTPEQAASPVDIETMDRLLGDRLTPAQRRFLRRLRGLLEKRRP
jgi:DNA-binding transcriptional MerR regulator